MATVFTDTPKIGVALLQRSIPLTPSGAAAIA